jgi:molybdopterin molybdotransferase
MTYTKTVPALSFTEARAVVLSEIRAAMPAPGIETLDLAACNNRILAEDIAADRDYPPFHRATRDGFAVRAADLPGKLKLIGEVRAGHAFDGTLHAHQAVEIMTGAPVPKGADAVVMVEHCTSNENGSVSTDRKPEPGENIAPRGCEAAASSTILKRGARLDYTAIACLASVGRASLQVFKKPEVAILCTGDEIVNLHDKPTDTQIRNSNAWSLTAQVNRAGGVANILPIARDTIDHTRHLIRQALASDLVLLSGGVSAGKYDVVEPTLEELGAEFYFDRVLIQPGQPLVFGKAQEKFFFGLPGNPASTMVTFELFARTAIALLSGATDTELPFAYGRLTEPFRHRAGLTRFLPANVRGAEVTPVSSSGSGDIPALCRSNAFLVADPETPDYATGDLIRILFK